MLNDPERELRKWAWPKSESKGHKYFKKDKLKMCIKR
jgi:hypothetical protein